MAAQIFTLQGVTLQGGGTLTGSFTTNDSLTALLAVDITASAGSYGGFNFAQFTYNDVSRADWVSLPTQGFQITLPNWSQQLRLNLLPLTANGAVIASPSSYEYQSTAGSRAVTGGSAVLTPVTAAVPEPAMWAMMIGGFALAGAALRRRPTATVSFA